MRTSAQLGVRRLEDPHQLRSALDDVIAEVDRLDSRITGLFEYAHVGKLRREETRFAELAEAALSEARPVIQARGITLRTIDETNGTDWLLDRQQMAEAIGELIANAAHHSNDQGVITLSGSVMPTNGEPNQLCVAVWDQGRGMSPECVQRVFDLFYTTRPEGSGMGLPLVRRIVERHRGAIQLQSAVGEGTRVTLTLPGRRPAVNPGSA
jgi:two-component system sensor histidine kinase HydH